MDIKYIICEFTLFLILKVVVNRGVCRASKLEISYHVALLIVKTFLNTLQRHPSDGDFSFNCINTVFTLTKVVGGIHVL